MGLGVWEGRGGRPVAGWGRARVAPAHLGLTKGPCVLMGGVGRAGPGVRCRDGDLA